MVGQSLSTSAIASCLANRTKLQVGKRAAGGFTLPQLLDDDLAGLVEEWGHQLPQEGGQYVDHSLRVDGALSIRCYKKLQRGEMVIVTVKDV